MEGSLCPRCHHLLLRLCAHQGKSSHLPAQMQAYDRSLLEADLSISYYDARDLSLMVAEANMERTTSSVCVYFCYSRQ